MTYEPFETPYNIYKHEGALNSLVSLRPDTWLMKVRFKLTSNAWIIFQFVFLAFFFWTSSTFSFCKHIKSDISFSTSINEWNEDLWRLLLCVLLFISFTELYLWSCTHRTSIFFLSSSSGRRKAKKRLREMGERTFLFLCFDVWFWTSSHICRKWSHYDDDSNERLLVMFSRAEARE